MTSTVWDEGKEPGRDIIALGAAVALTAVVLDLLIRGHVSWIFDVAFVALCGLLALRVRPRDFFVVGVLPPLLMLGLFVLLALTEPQALAERGDSAVQAVVTGLARHAVALLLGYALALGCLARRRHRTPA